MKPLLVRNREMAQPSHTGVQRKPKLWPKRRRGSSKWRQRAPVPARRRGYRAQARRLPERSRSVAMQATNPVPTMVPDMDAMIVHISHWSSFLGE